MRIPACFASCRPVYWQACLYYCLPSLFTAEYSVSCRGEIIPHRLHFPFVLQLEKESIPACGAAGCPDSLRIIFIYAGIAVDSAFRTFCIAYEASAEAEIQVYGTAILVNDSRFFLIVEFYGVDAVHRFRKSVFSGPDTAAFEIRGEIGRCNGPAFQNGLQPFVSFRVSGIACLRIALKIWSRTRAAVPPSW